MRQARKPLLRSMGVREARALLARHDVGRIAYVFHDHVDIQPIHYVLDGEWIYGRTSIGSKLLSLVHHRWCAFEVDQVRGPFDWESVVVKGAFYLLDPELASSDAYDRALTLLRGQTPGTLTAEDPVPHRTVLFRIHIDELTGRAADTAHTPGAGRRALVTRARRVRNERAVSPPPEIGEIRRVAAPPD